MKKARPRFGRPGDPTKEEVKAARKKLREARSVLTRHNLAKYRARTGGPPASMPSKERIDFDTWKHDVETLLAAAGRSPCSALPAAQLVDYVVEAADRMRAVVAARKPEGFDEYRPGRRVLHYGSGAIRQWREWQELFDNMVHALSERTDLNEHEVVARAEAIADLATTVIERRRPKKAGKAAA